MTIVAAATLAWIPMDPARVEQLFSRGWYPFFQPLATSISSLIPFALLDVWLVTALVFLVVGLWRVWRPESGSRLSALGGRLWQTMVMAAIVYLLFLGCWGLNYRRLPITAEFDFDRTRVTPATIEAASRQAVTALNTKHAGAHADLRSMPTMAALRVRLAPAFSQAQRELAATRLATPGRPKVSVLSPFFRWASVDGMVNPLGLEVIVNPDVLPVERPFVIAHEWGHLAGWALESEASYVAWLTCREGEHAAQYSGWLSLYWHLRRELSPSSRQAMDAALSSGPRTDLAAIAARLQQGKPLLQQASWQTYDQFLKANRVEAGLRSYDEVVTLVLGLGLEGRPRQRSR